MWTNVLDTLGATVTLFAFFGALGMAELVLDALEDAGGADE